MFKTLIAGNWKMHKTISEGVEFVESLKKEIQNNPERGVLLCVPFTMLHAVAEAAKGSAVKVGSEDIFYEEKGAFTGEISPSMIKDTGAEFTLIGHSERRVLFGETDTHVNKKIKAALNHGITPVLCVGESLQERESGQLETVLLTQIKGAFSDISEADAKKIIVAYEPVWAIGTGKTASPQDADHAHALTRKFIAEIYSQTTADQALILYGGSVKSDNIDELMAMPNINGALVGGASLEISGFSRIVNFSA